VGSSVIFDPSTYTSPNIPTLQSQAYQSGARISSNSWGNTSGNTYTADSQTYDTLVRDAQSGTAGNQEMVIVFAAGNSGSSSTALHAPATAKNVITVGAGENVQAFGGADASGIGDTGADNANDIISFSSRGPTGDGRKKPDIVAPGTHCSGGVAQASPVATGTGAADSCFTGSGVSGGFSSHYFPSSGQQFYTASSGTSHSTPCVAGGCALVRQFFINQGMAAPSPAMTKAFLMNSARYLTGVGAAGNLWSTSQGMGEMNLTDAFSRGTYTPSILRDEQAADMFTATGQTRVFVGAISDPSKPFRVTLAWTDAPGATSGSAWKNNLDLTVVIGGNIYKGNVFSGAFSTTGGSADASNNVESVFLPAGVSGAYTVTVTAANINSDGVPGVGGSLDQDFALVIANGGCVSPAVAGEPAATQTVCAGAQASFTMSATGSAVAYQWRKDTVNIGGANAPTFSIPAAAMTDAGAYDCVVTNACGTDTTTPALLTVVPSGITSQPTAQTGCVGGSVALAVGANTALSYQWRKGGVAVLNQTGASLTFSPAAATDAGAYDCLVTFACGTVATNAATVTINAAAGINTQPTSQSACVGGSATFTVSATGASPTYQWRKDGGPIHGANAATLTINSVGAGDVGSYDCVVASDCGGATSDSVTLSLSSPLSLGAQPQPQTACVGGMAVFTVSAPGATSFQWRKDGTPITGATAATLTINPVSAADAGGYDCIAAGGCGPVTSSAAMLTVPQGVSISGQPAASQSVCEMSPVTLSVTAAGTSPAYQWRKGGSPISGANGATLSVGFAAIGDSGTYDCVVSNTCGSATSNPAVVNVCSAVSIDAPPAPTTACIGGSATFTVAASGNGLTYQWRKGGSSISGAAAASLTINPVGGTDAGIYDCVVTNCCGSATSGAATLSVCRADFNCSGSVTVQDIFDFLGAWFTGDARADVNGAGGITGQDIFDFLGSWFQGC